MFEGDAVDDFGQGVWSPQAEPVFLCLSHELEDHEARGVRRQRALGTRRAVTIGGEDDDDEVDDVSPPSAPVRHS